MRIQHLKTTTDTKSQEWIMIKTLQEEIACLKSALHQLTHPPKLIPVRAGNKVNIISPANILYVQVDSNYSTIYLRDGKSLFTSRTLKHWPEEINDPFFERIHKSMLINTDRVTGIRKAEGVYACLFNDRSSVTCNQRSKYGREVKKSIPILRFGQVGSHNIL